MRACLQSGCGVSRDEGGLLCSSMSRWNEMGDIRLYFFTFGLDCALCRLFHDRAGVPKANLNDCPRKSNM